MKGAQPTTVAVANRGPTIYPAAIGYVTEDAQTMIPQVSKGWHMKPWRPLGLLLFVALSSLPLRVVAIERIPTRASAPGLDNSLHAKMGVECADCHTYQGPGDDGVCASCHKDIYTLYRGTPHGSSNAPKCTDCHDPHGIKGYKELSAQERIAMCTRCHDDYVAKHRWLPNTALHFLHLECTTCHSPDSRKGMIFHLILRTEAGKRLLLYEDLKHVLSPGSDIKALIDKDGDAVISSDEFTDFFLALRRSLGKGISIDGAILVTGIHHEFTMTRHREKECATCHSRNAPFYDSMYLHVPSMEGPVLVPVKDTILSALPIALSINLTLLGEEKIRHSDVRRLLFSGPEERARLFRELGLRWVDFCGLTLMFLLVVAMAFHAILRVVTRP